jgi:peptidyl-prolyl cis-trans isomerase B (cyclophilin B)
MKKLIIFITILLTFQAGVTMAAFSEPTKPLEFKEKTKYVAIIKTDKGVIECELFTKEAPLSVTNFVQLSKGDFYKNLTFHRVEPGFVIQGGDPDGNGTGGPGYTVKGEFDNGKKHIKGALAWARLGGPGNPDFRSSGSQFYITLAPTPFLDTKYTVFGQTTKGMDIVEKIAKGDKILSVEIKEVAAE